MTQQVDSTQPSTAVQLNDTQRQALGDCVAYLLERLAQQKSLAKVADAAKADTSLQLAAEGNEPNLLHRNTAKTGGVQYDDGKI